MVMELGFEDLSKNAKIVAVVIILLFIISFANAELIQFDNVKTYDVLKQEVTIINTFGIGGDIAKIKLNTPLNVIVPRGYQKIAEFEVTNYKDYVNAFESIEFYNYYAYKEDEKKATTLNRQYDYKYKSYETITITDYKTECSDFLEKNGTKTNLCYETISGTHEEQKEVWLPLEKLDFLSGEVVTIGIFTDVQKGDKVEWIPEFYGVKINEWASWTESIEAGLLSYWSFENPSGNLTDNVSTNQFSPSGGALYSQTGIVNKAVGFNSNEDYFIITQPTANLNFGATSDFAISLWIYANANVGDVPIFSSNGALAFPYYRLNPQDTSGVYGWEIASGGGADRIIVTSTATGTGEWVHLVLMRNDSGTDLWIYKNGVYDAKLQGSTTKLANTNDFYLQDNRSDRYFNGFMDEMGIWNRTLSGSEISDLYNGGLGLVYGVVLNNPSITLNSPEDYFNSSNPIINFEAEATDDFTITNVSLYLDGVINETNTSGVNGTYEFTKTLSEGEHYWSILAYDNDSNPTQSGDRYFTIDYTNPSINIYYPLNATYSNTTLAKTDIFYTNFTWTVSDDNLHTCIWYNGTANTTITCNSNATISLPFGTYTFIAYANDSVGLTASESITATYGYYLFENAVNYTRYTTEANEEMFNFTFNKTSLYTISSLDLVYNGTNYGVTDYSSTSNYQTLSKILQVPSVTADGNATFYFSVLFSDGTRVNSSTNTQFVNNTFLAVCNGTYTNKIFNLTLVDEATQTNLSNGSIEATISLYSKDKSTLISNYSTYINNTDNLQICLSEPTTQPDYLIDGVVKYNDLTHATEYYNFVNYSYVNATIGTVVILYDLLNVDSTEFQIIFRDENFVALPDVLIYVNREYISENTFKTVELPKTDSAGQTIVHLVRNDINYNIYAIKDGVILATFNNLRAYCEDYTIGNCKLYLTASSTSPSSYNLSEEYGISYSLAYSNVTNLITFNFVSSDLSTSKNVNMVVWRNTFMGNSSYCDTSLSSVSGTLTCNVTNIKDSDAILRVEIFVEGELLLNEYIDLIDKGTDKDYYFILLIFLLAFVFMFIESKTTVLVGIILGFGSAFALGLAKGKMFGLGSAGIFLIVVVLIMIWKLNREKQQ